MVRRALILAALALLVVSARSASGSGHGDPAWVDYGWLEGYTLVLLNNDDTTAAWQAREFVEASGGRIAVVTSPHAMVGWVPTSIANTLIGHYGIASIHYEPLPLKNLPFGDEPTVSLVKSFNSVVGGEYQSSRSLRPATAEPLVNDVFDAPELSYDAYIENLRGTILDTPSLPGPGFRTPEGKLVLAPGNSDAMTGTVSVRLFFVESDGRVDPDEYTWTDAAQTDLKSQVVTELSFWAQQAAIHGQCLTFWVTWYDRAFSEMHQPYEPIRHASYEDGLWINAVMANLGFDSGNEFARVTAFNSLLREQRQTDWAFSAFIAYNPPGAPDRFTDGYFAYAYSGGPFTQLCYKNDGYGVSQFGLVLVHETGHIFWACDEYYVAGYGGCTGCACRSFRPWALNGNCEHDCSMSNDACMMRHNSYSLCSFTPAQIGWEPPPCGDGIVDPWGEECDPPGDMDTCPSGEVCDADCTCRSARFTVTTTTDAVDVNVGDGVCDVGGGECALRAAIQEANYLPGRDTVILPAGVYTLTIAGTGEDRAATGDLDVVSDITLQGDGADTTIIDGNGIDRVFHVLGDQFGGPPRGNAVLRENAAFGATGITIQGGSDEGIWSDSPVTLDKVSIRGNGGSGIRGEYGAGLTVSGCTISGNTGGGVSIKSSSCDIISSTISSNSTAGDGGGIVSASCDPVRVTNSTISGNSAAGDGGGINSNRNKGSCEWSSTPELVLNNVTVTDNVADSDKDGTGDGGGRVGDC